MNDKKPLMNAFAIASAARQKVKEMLDLAQIDNRVKVVTSDKGPRVHAHVSSKNHAKAKEILPARLEDDTVQVLVWIDTNLNR